MPLRDRGTQGGHLYPVIISGADDGALLPVNLNSISPGLYLPVIPATSSTVFKTIPADTGFIDAFARQRFSEPFTLFDSKQIWNDPDIADNAENFPLFWDNQEVSGSGTTTLFNVNRASTTLGVSATTAGKRVRQTKQYFNYQPGKSQVAIFTDVDLDTTAGITKEIGLFTDQNGLFFRSSGGVDSVVIRSFATGAAVDRVFARNTWDDPMNGNGPSGKNLDLAKSQIPFVDFEWLGVGGVRFGYFIDRLPYYCQSVNNANNLDVVYMSSPNLPIRASIENDGTGAADTFEAICCTVISEGGFQTNGVVRWQDIGGAAASSITAAAIDTTYAICGIRLKAAYLSAIIDLHKISVVETSATNNPYVWRVHFNPTLTTGLTWADQPNSAIQFGTALAAGDVITSPGHLLDGDYQARGDGAAKADVTQALHLGSTIAGVSDIIVLSGTPMTVNQKFYGGIGWGEAW